MVLRNPSSLHSPEGSTVAAQSTCLKREERNSSIKVLVTQPVFVSHLTHSKRPEDIRTSLAQAATLITTITQLNSPLNTSPDAPPSVLKAQLAKRDRSLIEAMNELVTTFDRNVRVRYQVDVGNICTA